MARNRLYDVFLSHTSADKDAVEAIARRLEDEATLSTLLDKWHLIPGNPWQEELEQALDTSRTCVVFIGPHGIGPWENVEMRSALDDRVKRPGFRVIPVLLPGAVLPERGTLPRFLSSLTWVDCRSGLQDAEAFRRLVAGIRGQPPGRAREYVHGAHPPPDDQLPALSHYLGRQCRSAKKPGEKAVPKPSHASRRKPPTSRSPSCEDSTNPPPKRPSERLSALASSPDSPVWESPPHSNGRRMRRKPKGPLISPPGASTALATSPCVAPTMTPPARTSTRRWPYTSASRSHIPSVGPIVVGRIAADDERRRHVDAAKEAWQSIGRGDLMAELIEEFRGE